MAKYMFSDGVLIEINLGSDVGAYFYRYEGLGGTDNMICCYCRNSIEVDMPPDFDMQSHPFPCPECGRSIVYRSFAVNSRMKEYLQIRYGAFNADAADSIGFGLTILPANHPTFRTWLEGSMYHDMVRMTATEEQGLMNLLICRVLPKLSHAESPQNSNTDGSLLEEVKRDLYGIDVIFSPYFSGLNQSILKKLDRLAEHAVSDLINKLSVDSLDAEMDDEHSQLITVIGQIETNYAAAVRDLSRNVNRGGLRRIFPFS